MDSLLDSSWNVNTLQLRDIITLLILNSATLLPSVLSGLAVLSVLNPALFTGDRFLNRSLSDLTLTLFNIGTDSIWNITALLPGDRFICSPWNLIAHFLWNLTANWFRDSSWSRPITLLKGYLHKRKNKC